MKLSRDFTLVSANRFQLPDSHSTVMVTEQVLCIIGFEQDEFDTCDRRHFLLLN